jgi:hypothetical protein
MACVVLRRGRHNGHWGNSISSLTTALATIVDKDSSSSSSSNNKHETQYKQIGI